MCQGFQCPGNMAEMCRVRVGDRAVMGSPLTGSHMCYLSLELTLRTEPRTSRAHCSKALSQTRALGAANAGMESVVAEKGSHRLGEKGEEVLSLLFSDVQAAGHRKKLSLLLLRSGHRWALSQTTLITHRTAEKVPRTVAKTSTNTYLQNYRTR